MFRVHLDEILVNVLPFWIFVIASATRFCPPLVSLSARERLPRGAQSDLETAPPLPGFSVELPVPKLKSAPTKYLLVK